VNEFGVTINKIDFKIKVKMVRYYFDHSDAANKIVKAFKNIDIQFAKYVYFKGMALSLC
jgi:hypothetical protein